MKISVLLPTRGRADLFAESVRSLLETATAPGDVEIIARRDLDDPATYLRPPVPHVIAFGDPLGYAGLADYYNECARLARGDWLLVWNDDCVMRELGWDAVLRERDPRTLIALEHGHFPALHSSWVALAGRVTASPHADTYVCHVAEILIERGVLARPEPTAPWDIHHRADELADEGSERRRREVLGPDGTSARFFKPEMRAEIEADARAIELGLQL